MHLAFEVPINIAAEFDISVVVPFYNTEDTIEHCIRALIGQTYPQNRYEIIMVNNNSSDKSAEIVRRYPQVRLLFEKKQSAYAARNTGISAARGKVIAFTDSDCVPSKDWLENILPLLFSDNIGVVQGRRIYAFDTPALSIIGDYESERAAFTFSGNDIGLYYGYTNNMAIRRDLFDRSGPFLEIDRGADTLFVLEAIQKHSPEVVRYAPQARIRHLEITNPWKYFRKKFIYGQSFQRNYERRKDTHRPLTWQERKSIIKGTISSGTYSRFQILVLFCSVIAGAICFQGGRLKVRFSGQQEP